MEGVFLAVYYFFKPKRMRNLICCEASTGEALDLGNFQHSGELCIGISLEREWGHNGCS